MNFKPRLLTLGAATVLAVGLAGWAWRNNGEENHGIFLTVEGLYQRFHETRNRWPRSVSEAVESASEGESKIIDDARRKARFRIGTEVRGQEVRFEYRGRSFFGPFIIRRRLALKGEHYRVEQIP